jgi:hypothetical protein
VSYISGSIEGTVGKDVVSLTGNIEDATEVYMLLIDSATDFNTLRSDGLLSMTPRAKFTSQADQPVFVQSLYDANTILQN